MQLYIVLVILELNTNKCYVYLLLYSVIVYFCIMYCKGNTKIYML